MFDDNVVILLQIPSENRSLLMNIYKVYNLPILHPKLQKCFQCTLEGEYLTISSYGDHATLHSTQNVIVCTFTKGHMCQVDIVLYPVAWVTQCIYTLFTNSAQQIKKDCQYDIKHESYNVVYSLKRCLWVINSLSTEELQVRGLRRHYRVSIKPPLQLVYLPNT